MPIESGVVLRFRLRRRPSEASSAVSSWLQTSAGRTIDHLDVERESLLHRTPVLALQCDQIKLDGLEILEQKVQGRQTLQTGDGFEVSPAARAGLHLDSLRAGVRFQRSQFLMVALTAVDTEEPGDLPVGGAATASQSAASIQSSALGEQRPGSAYRAITRLPVAWQLLGQQAATGLQHGKGGQVGYCRQSIGIDAGRGCQLADDLTIVADRRGDQLQRLYGCGPVAIMQRSGGGEIANQIVNADGIELKLPAVEERRLDRRAGGCSGELPRLPDRVPAPVVDRAPR